MEVTQLLELPDGWALMFAHHEFDNGTERLRRPGIDAEGPAHVLRRQANWTDPSPDVVRSEPHSA
jgi:hypothetical protein